jgi:hypothetical protein
MRKNTLQHRNWISRTRLAAASAALALVAVMLSAVITAQPAQAQYTTLASFDGTNGSYSLAPLVQATNGKQMVPATATSSRSLPAAR